MSDSRMWSCPTCGRKFVNANQWHSCSLAEVSSHVAKSEPEIARVYHLLAERIVNLGSVEVQPMKTAIVFKAVTTFAGVQVRKRWLNLGLLLDDRLASPRFDRGHDPCRPAPTSIGFESHRSQRWMTSSKHGFVGPIGLDVGPHAELSVAARTVAEGRDSATSSAHELGPD